MKTEPPSARGFALQGGEAMGVYEFFTPTCVLGVGCGELSGL
jgi:hypothetical protein